MKISELQELLEMTKERHGDLEVGVYKKSPFINGETKIKEINRLQVVRETYQQTVKIDETFRDIVSDTLVFEHINNEEDESDERPPRATHPNT